MSIVCAEIWRGFSAPFRMGIPGRRVRFPRQNGKGQRQIRLYSPFEMCGSSTMSFYCSDLSLFLVDFDRSQKGAKGGLPLPFAPIRRKSMSTAKRRRLDNLETASTGSGRGAAAASANTGSRRANAGAGVRGGNGSSGRTAGGASAGYGQAGSSSVNVDNGNNNPLYVPVLSLATLPVAALSRYALHYGLIGPDPLTHAQATHPTPPLPLHLSLAAGPLSLPRRRASLVPARRLQGQDRPDPAVVVTESEAVPPSTSITATTTAAATAGSGDAVPAQSQQPGSTAGTTSVEDASTLTQQQEGDVQPGHEAIKDKGENRGTAPTAMSKRNNRGDAWRDPGEPDAQELRGMTAFEGGHEQFQDKIGALAKAHWDKYQTVKEGETIVNFAYAIRMRSALGFSQKGL